jgi:hypothetical protein
MPGTLGRFRTANRHFKQAGNIVEYYGFKAPFVGGLPRQIHPTIHPPYGHLIMQFIHHTAMSVAY